jgi:heat shock protein 5
MCSNLLGFSGKSEQIVVSNDKSRLTKEQIDKMIADGDKFAAEDDLHKKHTEALNGLSSFVYGLKSQLGDKGGMGAKLDRADKTKLQTIINQGSEWIDEYGKEATLEELEEKLAGVYTFDLIFIGLLELKFAFSDLQAAVSPITSKLYQDESSSSKDDKFDPTDHSEL